MSICSIVIRIASSPVNVPLKCRPTRTGRRPGRREAAAMSVISGGLRWSPPLSRPSTLKPCSPRSSHGRSLWPSISGVARRMRSIRALVRGSMVWALAGAARAMRREHQRELGRGKHGGDVRARPPPRNLGACAARHRPRHGGNGRQSQASRPRGDHALRPRGRDSRARRASRPAQAAIAGAGPRVRPPRGAQRAAGGDLRQAQAGDGAACCFPRRGRWRSSFAPA